ncbi:MAG: FlgD immunoglobulin-like domain containing protein [Rhodothermales bacterium]
MWYKSISIFLALIVLCFSSVSAQETFFVASDGSDTNPGTMEEPLASMQKAQEMVSPGDTVYIRGGTYQVTEDQISAVVQDLFASITYLNKSGAEGNTIKYWAYPGETPLFDYSAVKPQDKRVVGIYVDGSYLHIKGLEMTGIQTTITGHTESYCIYSKGSNNIFERLSMHDNVGTGLRHYGGGGNLFLNLDAYRNWDNVSEQGIGDNNDGFGIHPREGSEVNIIKGSRAWFNSDDGFDIIRAGGPVVIDSSWAFYNGFSSTFQPLGDGNGFKAGGHAFDTEDRLPAIIPRHTIRFSVAVRNKANGFYANHHIGGNDWYNNTGYRNSSKDFNMLNRPTREDASNIDGPGYDHVLKNNLAAAQFGDGTSNIVDSLNTQETNTWTLGISIVSDDFLSIDLEQLTAPRKADGSLPDIDLFRPAAGSEIIDAGVDIGFDFLGEAPDLGAFEADISTGTSISPEDQMVPDKSTLYPNYPNPFNPETAIRYALTEPGHVTLSIYNMLGQKVRTLVGQHQHAGEFIVQWHGDDDASKQVASGIYLYQLSTSSASGTQTRQRQMILLK